jgi:exosortase
MTASNISQPAPGTVAALRSSAVSSASRPTPQWLGPVIGATALLAICGWLFWDFVAKQIRYAVTQQADWGHTLVIPFIAGYFVYIQRDRLLATPFKTTWFGLAIMVIGVGLYMACAAGPLALRHHNTQGVSVAITITGLTLLFCGWNAMRWLAFPLAYLFVFSQTISERLLHTVTFFMQDITARGSAILLSLFLDVDRLGNTIYIAQGAKSVPLNIAEACSGMRMLMAFLALGTAMAYTGLPFWWQRALLVAMGVPTAIFVNILRVCTLGVLTLADAGYAAGDFHSFIGLLWLLPAFAIYLGLMWIIRRLVIEEDTPPAPRAPVAA